MCRNTAFAVPAILEIVCCEELKLDGRNNGGQARLSKHIPKRSFPDRHPRLLELFLCERAF